MLLRIYINRCSTPAKLSCTHQGHSSSSCVSACRQPATNDSTSSSTSAIIITSRMSATAVSSTATATLLFVLEQSCKEASH
jgi:hypothetical protein